MSGDDFGQLIYLVLLGAVIAGYYLIGQRQKLGETARYAALWGFIFIGVIVVYGLWNDVQNTVTPRAQIDAETGRIELPRNPDSHYYLTLDIGGTPLEFVVDTGATDVVLSRQDAERVGINTDELLFAGRAFTANGEVRTASVTLRDVRLGDIEEGSVRASVSDGQMSGSLLGMSYLERFSRIEISGNRLILER